MGQMEAFLAWVVAVGLLWALVVLVVLGRRCRRAGVGEARLLSSQRGQQTVDVANAPPQGAPDITSPLTGDWFWGRIREAVGPRPLGAHVESVLLCLLVCISAVVLSTYVVAPWRALWVSVVSFLLIGAALESLLLLFCEIVSGLWRCGARFRRTARRAKPD